MSALPGCCLCGGRALSATKDWPVYLCERCYLAFGGYDSRLEQLVCAAYAAGRASVLGGQLEPDEQVERGMR